MVGLYTHQGLRTERHRHHHVDTTQPVIRGRGNGPAPADLTKDGQARVLVSTPISHSYSLNFRQHGRLYVPGEVEFVDIHSQQEYAEAMGGEAKVVLGVMRDEYQEGRRAEEFHPLPASYANVIDNIPAKVAGNIGYERSWHNIVGFRVEGDTVIAEHVSDADRTMIEIKDPDLVKKMRAIPIKDCDRQEISSDGKTLYLYDGIREDLSGNPMRYSVDISKVKFNRAKVYQPKEFDEENSPKLIKMVPEELVRVKGHEKVHVFYNKSAEETRTLRVVTWRENDKMTRAERVFHTVLYQKIRTSYGEHMIYARCHEDGTREIMVTDPDGERTILRAETQDQLHAQFFHKKWEVGLRNEVIHLFQKVQPIEIKGNPKHDQAYQDLSAENKRAVVRAYRTARNTTFETVYRPKGWDPAFFFEFHESRESVFADALLHAGVELQPGERVVIIKPQSATTLVYTKDTEAHKKGDLVLQPLNFDPTQGHWDQAKFIRPAMTPHEMYKTTVVWPVVCALAGQNLGGSHLQNAGRIAIDVGLLDQSRSFFGITDDDAVSFPNGLIFMPRSELAHYSRMAAGADHTLFGGKGEAGSEFFFLTHNVISGPRLTGQTIETGPSLEKVNAALHHHLHWRMLPNRRVKTIKTMIPGFFLSIIEDADGSFKDNVYFGLITIGENKPFAWGGGINNFEVKRVQRMRWAGGIGQRLFESGLLRWQDIFRGNMFYMNAYNAVHTSLDKNSGLWVTDSTRYHLNAQGRLDSLMAEENMTPKELERRLKIFSKNAPLLDYTTKEQDKETRGVGTWYSEFILKVARNSIIPLAIGAVVATSCLILGLPVFGPTLLGVSVGTVLFSWTSWTNQLVKAGVNPKHIQSLKPTLSFGQDDLTRDLTFESVLKMMKVYLGEFIRSDKNTGNKVTPANKRFILWRSAVAPIAAGVALLVSSLMVALGAAIPLATLGLSMTLFAAGCRALRHHLNADSAIGLGSTVMLGSLLLTAPTSIAVLGFGVAIGGLTMTYFASKWCHELAVEFLHNPKSASFLKSAAQLAAKWVPLTLGIAYVAWFIGANAIFPIAGAAAIMGGFWTLFYGGNVFALFARYHEEQRMMSLEPEPHQSIIKPHEVDTPMGSVRDMFNFRHPLLLDEDFNVNDPETSARKTWTKLNGLTVYQAFFRHIRNGKKTKDLQGVLFCCGVTDAKGHLARNYQRGNLLEALHKQGLHAGEFEKKFDISVEFVEERLELCQRGDAPGLLVEPEADWLANLNRLVCGEKTKGGLVLHDLHLELKGETLERLQSKPRINRLLEKTARLTAAMAQERSKTDRTAERLQATPDELYYLQELNREVLEAKYFDNMPQRPGRAKQFLGMKVLVRE
ncbi:MAG: hypothetical protein ABIE84_06310, partial [bacterium]